MRAGLGAYVGDVTVGDEQYLYKCDRTCVGHGHPAAACRKDVCGAIVALVDKKIRGSLLLSPFAVHDMLRYRTIWTLPRANGVPQRCFEFTRQDASTLPLAR